MDTLNSSNIKTLEFDVLVIGGGGSGMRTSLELAKSGLKTAVFSKVFPTRSHTVAAQGGITCAIASADPEDDWRWHMYDTIKGSDYIGDQDAIEYMCKNANRLYLNSNIWAYHFLEQKMDEFTKDHLAGNLRILERAAKHPELVRLLIGQDMLCFTRFIKIMLKKDQIF